MSRRDLRPLSKESAKKIEWIKARQEVKIQNAMLAWHADGSKSKDSPPMITREQQSHLQGLVIEMAVQLGETEG